VADLAGNAHPDMIPDLRAYAVYALATTGGAPKDALDKAWDEPRQAERRGAGADWAGAGCGWRWPREAGRGSARKEGQATDVDAYWEGTYDGLLDFWDDTSPETTAFALKLLVEGSLERLMPKAARWLAEHRDGDYWYSTKQTSMVIQGLTDYLALSGELANTSDVEVLVNGTSVGKRHFGPDDAFAAPWQIKFPRRRRATADR
jgi:alpha-2-macroglobulin